MQTGPIFLAYRAKEDLKEKIGELKKQAPVYDLSVRMESGIVCG